MNILQEHYDQDIEVLRNIADNKAILTNAIKHYDTLLRVYPANDAFSDTVSYIRTSNQLKEEHVLS